MRSTSADLQPTSGLAADGGLERWAAFTPLVIIIYFAVQLAVRLWLSPNLEVDDAEMVGEIHWAWGYSNSHPPLYHWLVRLCHDLFGGNWVAATSVPKYCLLAIGYLLIYDAGRRASGRRLTGALAAATLLLIPVIAWKTQGKLTHSILGFTATAATVHAAVVIARGGGAWAFAWLGLAAAVGILAKYNYLLVLAALALACTGVKEMRQAFARRAALLAPLVTFTLIAPHLLWIRANPELATERVYMLQTGGGPLGLNLPASNVGHGLLSLVLVVLVSTVPAAAVWALAVLSSRGRDDEAAPIARFVGILLLAQLAVFIVTVVFAGFTQVHERYLVVLLPPVALWFVLALRRRSAAFVLGAAALVAVGVTVARPVSVLRGSGRLLFPYAAMAQEISAFAPAGVAVLADRPENAGNLVMRLPGADVFDRGASADHVLVVADTRERLDQLSRRMPAGFTPDTEVRQLARPFQIPANRQAELAVQVWRRSGAAQP